MLKQRIITAMILAPLMLAGIYLLPDAGFRVFIGIIVMLGAWEWANLSGFESQPVRVGFALASGLFLFVLQLFISADGKLWLWIVLSVVLWWMLATRIVFLFPRQSEWLNSKVLRALAMIPVLGGFWMGLVWLNAQSNASLLLTWLMLLVWGADIGAYFSGRAFGKKKLAPRVSPGKTWAGVYGGMLTSVLASIVIAFLYLPSLSLGHWLWMVIMSAVVISISVLGDLFESLLKRHRQIKDSSQLLPGHGGILDRIDSMCAATPLFVLFWSVLTVMQ